MIVFLCAGDAMNAFTSLVMLVSAPEMLLPSPSHTLFAFAIAKACATIVLDREHELNAGDPAACRAESIFAQKSLAEPSV
jgi:hypothetical protein